MLNAGCCCISPPGAGAVPVAGYSPDADLRLVRFIVFGVANRVRSHSKYLAHRAISALYRLRKC
jgi:hypothetical protein